MREPTTTVTITREMKGKLDSIKVHKRETYNDVMERLYASCGRVSEGVKADN